MPHVKVLSLGYGLASGIVTATATTFVNSPFVVALVTGILAASGVIIAARIAANAQHETDAKLRKHGKALDALMAGQFKNEHPELLEGGGFPVEVDMSIEDVLDEGDE